MKRLENWPLILSSFLRSRSSEPFEWGRNDCILFAADAVLALTGEDVAAQYRGKYDSEESAKALMAPHGNIINAITSAMGVEPIKNYLCAARGDVVCIRHSGVKACGVVDDTGTRVAVITKDGLARVGLVNVLFVWKY